jgi:hypothetical protein
MTRSSRTKVLECSAALAAFLLFACGEAPGSSPRAPSIVERAQAPAAATSAAIANASAPSPAAKPPTAKPPKAAPVSVIAESDRSIVTLILDDGALLYTDDKAWILGPKGLDPEPELMSVVAATRPLRRDVGGFRIVDVDGTAAAPIALATAEGPQGVERRDFVKRGGKWTAIATTRSADVAAGNAHELKLRDGTEIDPKPDQLLSDCAKKGETHRRFDAQRQGDGTVVAVGTACSRLENEGRLVLERWPSGASPAEIITIPGAPGFSIGVQREYAVVPFGAKNAWIAVYGSAGGEYEYDYVGRLVDGAFSNVTPKHGEHALHALDDGQALIAYGKDLFYVIGAGDAGFRPIPGLGVEEMRYFFTTPKGLAMAGTAEKMFVLAQDHIAWEECLLPTTSDGTPIDSTTLRSLVTFENGDKLLAAKAGKKDVVLRVGSHRSTVLD